VVGIDAATVVVGPLKDRKEYTTAITAMSASTAIAYSFFLSSAPTFMF
jgi:hypothetical protein